MQYANQEKVIAYKVYADDQTTDKPYGVETTLVNIENSTDTIWFKTQEEQQYEYETFMAEVSRGEVV